MTWFCRHEWYYGELTPDQKQRAENLAIDVQRMNRVHGSAWMERWCDRTCVRCAKVELRANRYLAAQEAETVRRQEACRGEADRREAAVARLRAAQEGRTQEPGALSVSECGGLSELEAI